MPCSRIPLIFKLYESASLCNTEGNSCATCFGILSDLNFAQLTAKQLTGELKVRMNKKGPSRRPRNSSKERDVKTVKFEDEEDELDATSGMIPPLDVWENPAPFLRHSSDNFPFEIYSTLPKKILTDFQGPETGKPRRKRGLKADKKKCKLTML
ncbi:hypothetical protein TCAL_15993, partial [Tigriopus californicus]